MNIDDLTIGEARKLAEFFCKGESSEAEPFLGKYVIVRTYSAGVFAGTLKQRIGKKVLLENVRRLWRWQTANNGISLSEIAVYGINQQNSKICCTEPLKLIQDIEISQCSDISRASIEGAKDYVYS